MNCCEKCDKPGVKQGRDALPQGKMWCVDCPCHTLPGEITYKTLPNTFARKMKVTDTTSPEKNFRDTTSHAGASEIQNLITHENISRNIILTEAIQLIKDL